MKKWLIIFSLLCPVMGVAQMKAGLVPVRDTAELKVGDRVPNFVFRDTANREVSLKQFRGKYVVTCGHRGVTLVSKSSLL